MHYLCRPSKRYLQEIYSYCDTVLNETLLGIVIDNLVIFSQPVAGHDRHSGGSTSETENPVLFFGIRCGGCNLASVHSLCFDYIINGLGCLEGWPSIPPEV